MEIKNVELVQLRSSKDQPPDRTKDVAALAASIKAIGILQPIVVRQVAVDSFEIIAGNRRAAAAKLAGLAGIPAVIVGANDNRAQVIRITENVQRKQMDPLEEAEAIKVLKDLGRSMEEIAADLGMSATYVARRAKLCDLVSAWIQRIRKPAADNANVYTTSHLELIARYESRTQMRLLERFRHYTPSLDELKRELADSEHNLTLAPWELDDDSLVPRAGSCTACAKRSHCQPLLFDDGDTKQPKAGDKCLDLRCWEEKLAEFTKRRAAQLKVEHPNMVKISTDWRNKPGVLVKGDYILCAKKANGAKPALWIDGPQTGKTTWVSTDLRAAAGGTKKAKAKFTDKDRKERLINRRSAHIVGQILTALEKKAPLDISAVKGDGLHTALAACLAFGLSPYELTRLKKKTGWAAFAEADTVTDSKTLTERWWDVFRHEAAARLRSEARTGTDATKALMGVGYLLNLIGKSLTDLAAIAAQEIPDRHGLLGPAAEKPAPTPKTTTEPSKGPKAERPASRGTKTKGKAKRPVAPHMAPHQPSAELAQIVGDKPLCRGEVSKLIWVHIKKHGLQDQTDRRMINPDEKLGSILGHKPISMFNMTKVLAKHITPVGGSK